MQDKTTKKRQPCEVYSRVVGYLSPVQRWNAGKKEEFKNRKVYNKQLRDGMSNA